MDQDKRVSSMMIEATRSGLLFSSMLLSTEPSRLEGTGLKGVHAEFRYVSQMAIAHLPRYQLDRETGDFH